MTWFRRAVLLPVLSGLLFGLIGPSDPAAAQADGGRLPALGANAGAATGALRARRFDAELERAWRSPGRPLAERAASVRGTALEFGVRNLDPAARALILNGSPGKRYERASAAVRLAPDLPAAHMALARAHLADGDGPVAAVRSVIAGLAAIPRQLEASLWLASTGLYVLAVVLTVGSLLFIAAMAVGVSPDAIHDLGDVVSGAMPEFARGALLCCVLLLPLLLGEGVVGLAVILLAIGFAYGRAADRVSLLVAATALTAGLYPAAEMAGRTLSALRADPVATAAYAVDRGIASPLELARLEAAADADPLALRALAVRARRVGDLPTADARYRALLEMGEVRPDILNNAANVLFARRDTEGAIAMYEASVAQRRDATVFYNLSQAYGRAIRVDDLNRALTEAQALDREAVAELTGMQAQRPDGFVADLPLRVEPVRKRMLLSARGDAEAQAFRAPLAPGRLGESRAVALAGFGIAIGFSVFASSRFRRSRRCSQCGNRQCPRCEPGSDDTELCQACTRLFRPSDTADHGLRTQRIAQLRKRRERLSRLASAVSILVPGVAGILAGRPALGLAGGFLFVAACSCVLWTDGIVPDPLAAGAAGSFALLLAGAGAAIVYLGLVFTCLHVQRGR